LKTGAGLTRLHGRTWNLRRLVVVLGGSHAPIAPHRFEHYLSAGARPKAHPAASL
jgi:hypothetical protein